MSINKYAPLSKLAQRRRKVWNACERKKGYPSREAAIQKGQDIYRCAYCRQWHRSGAVAKTLARVRGNV